MSTTQTWRQCTLCHGVFIEPEIAYMADPYRQELLGDQTRMWICTKCQKQRKAELKAKGKKAEPPEPPKKERSDKEKEAKLNLIAEQLGRIEDELKQIRKTIKDIR